MARRSREEIREQLFRYCRGVDRQDEALLNSVFHPGAVFDDGHPIVAADLAHKVGRIDVRPRMHFIGNILIETNDDCAFVESYFVSASLIAGVGGARARTRMRGGRWLDRFERRESSWRIAHRRVIDEWARLDELVETPEVGQHRGSPAPHDAVYHMGLLRASRGEHGGGKEVPDDDV